MSSFTELALREGAKEDEAVDPDATEKTDVPENSPMFLCPTCESPTAFTTQRGLSRHITAMHAPKKRKKRAKKEAVVVEEPKLAELTVAECDQILAIVLPNGIPARSEFIAILTAWLDSGAMLRQAANR